MKKTICLFLTLALVLTLAACGKSEAEITPAPSGSASAATDVPQSPQESPGAPEPAAPSEPAAPAEPPIPGTEPAPAPEPSADDEKPAKPAVAERLVSMAYELIGCAFESGGQGPDTFDNSGFVYYICRENGIPIPRRTSEMADYEKGVGWDDLRPGDICVMANEIGGGAGFVGIYVGDMQFIACNKPGTAVKLQKLDVQYWRDRFLSGRRVAWEG